MSIVAKTYENYCRLQEALCLQLVLMQEGKLKTRPAQMQDETGVSTADSMVRISQKIDEFGKAKLILRMAMTASERQLSASDRRKEV